MARKPKALQYHTRLTAEQNKIIQAACERTGVAMGSKSRELLLEWARGVMKEAK